MFRLMVAESSMADFRWFWMNEVNKGGLLHQIKGKQVLIAFAVMMAGSTWLFNAGPFSLLASFGAGPAPEETFSPAAVLPQYLKALCAKGRAVYQSHLLWDFLNPLLMAPFFVLLIAWLVQKIGVSSR